MHLTLIDVVTWILNFLPSVVLLVVSYIFTKTMGDRDREITEERTKSRALAEGVEALLRQSIINSYNKYNDRGFCPIYAKEGIKRVYIAYHNLGGNDVATELYHKILQMPEEPAEGDSTYE